MLRSTTTILLIHGLWMTPRSWDLFRSHYERRGYRVITPSWPRLRGEVADIRHRPHALAGLGLREVTEYYADLVRSLDAVPVLMGHSMGGLVVQQLLAQGLGIAGVAIDSATPKGVYRLPWSVLRSGWPVLSNPLNYWGTVMLTFEQFRYAFAHVMPEDAARAAYDNYVVPGPGRPLFEVASGNFNPWAANRVNFRATPRAPLLLIGGTEDRLVPAALNRINHRLYAQSPTQTAYKEFTGRAHLIVAQAGWQEVADYALNWALSAAARTESRPPLSHASQETLRLLSPRHERVTPNFP